MDRYCHDCQTNLARIHGRTLKQALAFTRTNHAFGNITATQWVDICPICDAYALGMEANHPWPFLCAKGVMRTVEDFDPTPHNPVRRVWTFIVWSSPDRHSTAPLSSCSRNLRERAVSRTSVPPSRVAPMSSLDFSQAVCA